MIATYDIAIIGGGIAGAAAAANLAKDFKVLLLERESQPGYHATGRSAALFSEIYGNTSIIVIFLAPIFPVTDKTAW